MKRFPICILLSLLSIASSLNADEVLTVDRRGKRVPRKGVVLDYKNRELTLQTLGREVMIPSKNIVQIDTDWLPQHEQADAQYELHQYAAALQLYRETFQAEKRRWVKRLLLARVIRCQANMGRVEDACKNFSRLTTDDPRTIYFDTIPLAWENRPPRETVVQQVLPWIGPGNPASDRLLAASWLLHSARKSVAIDALRDLAREEWEPVAKLAVSQLWRAELTTIKKTRLAWWREHVEAVPIELRAGSYYLFGLSLAQHDNVDGAALSLLRVTAQYPHDWALANTALFRCGELLHQAGRTYEARRCFEQVIERKTAQTSAAKEILDRMEK